MNGALSFTISDIQRHVEFLENLHDDPLNQQCAFPLDRSILGFAVTRFVMLLLCSVMLSLSVAGS